MGAGDGLDNREAETNAVVLSGSLLAHALEGLEQALGQDWARFLGGNQPVEEGGRP